VCECVSEWGGMESVEWDSGLVLFLGGMLRRRK
jgi:hypothetical protein